MKTGVSPLRQRYHLAVSTAYLLLGLVILARSIFGHVLPVGLVGVVLIALALVRFRDFRVWKERRR